MKPQNVDFFLSNPEFIKWVKRNTVEGNLYWKHWLEMNPESKNNMQLAREIILSFEYHKPPENQMRHNKILSNILSSESSSTRVKRDYFPYWLLKIAAIFFVIGVVAFLWVVKEPLSLHSEINIPTEIKKYNPAGFKTKIILPDSSVVFLNSESTLRYYSDFLNSREIYLDGEAYFEVKQLDEKLPFRVHSKKMTATVLGTSFNIRAFTTDSAIQIALIEGGIRVEYEKSEKLLVPDELLTIDTKTGNMYRTTFLNDYNYAWKDGILVFKRSNLSQFVSTIERWYGIKVTVLGKPKEDWEIDGRFKNMSLDLVMESIAFATNVDFKITKDNLLLMFN